MFVEDLWRIPMSQELATSVTRAVDDVQNLQHIEISLEHLLVSLIEDRDAKEMLIISNIDTNELLGEVLEYTGQLPRGEPPHNFDQIPVCNNLKRVMGSAAAAARQGGRKEINGAIVLAAIVGDGKSLAADFLRAKGLTFEQAIRSIQRALIPKPLVQPSLEIIDAPPETVKSLSVEKPSEVDPIQELQQVQPSYGGAEHVFSEIPTSVSVRPPKIFQEHVKAQQGSVSSPSKEIPQSSHSRSVSTVAQPARGNFSPRPPHTGLAQSNIQRGSAALFTIPAGHSANPSSTPHSIPPVEQRNELQKMVRASSSSRSENLPLSSVSKNIDLRRQHSEQQSAQVRDPQSSPPRSRGFPSKGTVRIAASQLVVNMPRRMRVQRPVLIEARVPRSDIKAISEGLQDGGAVYRHEIAITKAISVRLRAPQGGFWIENASPETQWVENILGVVSDDYIRWRWSVTPKTRGKKTLQILMSARTVGTDGVAAETALPDQVLQVKVRSNYVKFFFKSFNWLLLIGLLVFVMRHWDNITGRMGDLIKLVEALSRG